MHQGKTPMSQTSSEVSVFRPTQELRQVLGNPALVGHEKLEDYERLFTSVASAIKPPDEIGWLLTKDVVDWSWEMHRERAIKADIIRHYQKEVVAELIPALAAPGQLGTAMYRIFQANDDLTLWATDPEARVKIDEALADKGHDASSILARAYMRGSNQIDAIDRRIAGYERRRNTALKEAGLWNDRLLRRLDQASHDVIDVEFTETAEQPG
jgi:hypothetical protein